MKPVGDDGAARDVDRVLPSESARVRLEVEILANDLTPRAAVPAPAADSAGGLETRTVLVVAAEADVRRYVRECLREVSGIRVLEAATIEACIALVNYAAPDLMIIDGPQASVSSKFPAVRAILISDDAPADVDGVCGARLLARPFTAEGLAAEVIRAMG